MTKKILIAGIGNIARMDDGIGVHVIRYINESNNLNTECAETLEIGGAIYDLLPCMTGRSHIIIVDALMVEDIPGSVYHIPSGDLKQDNFNIFKFSPELREILFQHYIAVNAAEIDFIGIVPEDVTTEMIGLTDSTRVGLVFAVNEVLKTVNHISRNADIENITF